MKTKLLALVTLGLIALGFQNCSNTSFSNADAQTLSKLNGEDATLTLIDEADGAQEGDVLISTTPEAPVVGRGQSAERRPSGEVEVVPSDDVSNRLFVCVVEGPGKSHKVAYMNDAIISKVGTPADICMSEKACTDIISQAMVVKGPEKRGFCPDKNPHVVNFSDVEIQNLVNKLKQK